MFKSSWVFIFLACCTLVLASHLVPSISKAIGQSAYAVSGHKTFAFQVSEGAERLSVKLKRQSQDVALLSINVANLRRQLIVGQRRLGAESQRVALLEAQVAKLKAIRPANAPFKLEKLRKMSARTKTVAGANVAAMVGEAIPFYGVAIVVAATSYELHAACETMKDIDALVQSIDISASVAEDTKTVCGLEVPTKEEVWSTLKSSPGSAWQTSIAAFGESKQWVAGLEAPDFSGVWARALGWFD